MFIREIRVETQITEKNTVYRIESCSEYSEQDILQMLQEGKAAKFFSDQIPPYSFISQINPHKTLANVYSGADQEKMTHTRDKVEKITYSLFKP